MRVFCDLTERAINGRMPTGTGRLIYDENRNLYGKTKEHNARYRDIEPNKWNDLLTNLNAVKANNNYQLREQRNGNIYRFEIVVAGFNNPQNREVSVIFRGDDLAEARRLYNLLLQDLNVAL